MSPRRTHGWLKGIYLCFSQKESGIELLFLQEPDQQVLLGGQCCPRKAEPKPDIPQNDFIHNHWCADDCNQSKISIFFLIFIFLRKARKLLEVEGNVHRSNRHVWRFLQNLAPSQPKNSRLGSLHHPRLAQVKTDGIPETSCRLKPDFTLSEFVFFPCIEPADGFDK